MCRLFLSCLLLSVAFLPLSGQTHAEWRDSLARLNDSIRLHPHDVDFRLRKAAVNIQLEQWDYAVDEYGRVLQLEPKNLAALYFRAYANSTLRHYDLAKTDYEAFLTVAPKHFEAQLGLAFVKEKMGRTTDALDDLNRLVQMFPDSALAYAARAGLEAAQQHYDLALYDWDEALKRNPRSVDMQVSKVDVLISMKRYDEAWRLLEQLMRQGVPRAALKEWIDRCR